MADWSNAYHNLQPAITASQASTDDQVWVADGTYKPHASDPGVSFQLKNGISVQGGYRGFTTTPGENPDDRNPLMFETFLSGDLDGDDAFDDNAPPTPHVYGNYDDNSHHVVKAVNGVNAPSVPSTANPQDKANLDGVTIRGGNAQEGASDHRGGGLHSDDSSPVIRGCKIIENYAYQSGGGVSHVDSGHITLRNCTITHNRAENHAGGGVVNFGFSGITVVNTMIAHNFAYQGGGLETKGAAGSSIVDCKFLSNYAYWVAGGLAVFNTGSSAPKVVNCLFSGNIADTGLGGGIACEDANVDIINCTITQNDALQAGGIMVEDSNPDLDHPMTIQNCIVWGNTGLAPAVHPGRRGGFRFDNQPDALARG